MTSSSHQFSGIGFGSADVGLDADKCKVLVNIEQQSPEIAQSVHGNLTKKPVGIGAGDQVPLTHVVALSGWCHGPCQGPHCPDLDPA